jgi:hypothetical protein
MALVCLGVSNPLVKPARRSVCRVIAVSIVAVVCRLHVAYCILHRRIELAHKAQSLKQKLEIEMPKARSPLGVSGKSATRVSIGAV